MPFTYTSVKISSIEDLNSLIETLKLFLWYLMNVYLPRAASLLILQTKCTHRFRFKTYVIRNNLLIKVDYVYE